MYVADFETITDPADCRVWAYAIRDIYNDDNIYYGNNIEDFFNWCRTTGNYQQVFFHNLKFDGSFILDWLLKNGFKHVTNKDNRDDNTFTTLISDGMFYDITVYFNKKGRRWNYVTFRDSLKLLPLSVDNIAKSFNLPISKLKLDYNEYRGKDHILTDDEVNYITNDVKIVAKALRYLFEQEMTKMTTASNALNEYKKIISKKTFERMYPPPMYDKDIRQSYKGGFTYLNPKYANKEVKTGIVFDVNSLYPSVMYYEKLPYGQGIWFEGKYEPDELYDLYVQQFTCTFELKEGYLPTIQLKNNMRFIPTQYITSSNDEEVTLCLTSVDMELFLEHYNVYNIEYHSGWKFKSAVGLFKDYIDKWSANKIQAKIDGNGGLYTLSKLMLNSLYGKFGSRVEVRQQIPYLDEEGVVRFQLGEVEEKEPLYIPMASFITAWARNKTIRSAQKVYDRFVYADTDSLHLEGTEIPKELDVDDTKLGAWKHESTFKKAKFIRAKTYIEQEIIEEKDYLKGLKKEDNFLYSKDEEGFYKLKITVAGMPNKCYDQVTFENFKPGAIYGGKLLSKRVSGGAVLEETTFEIKI